MTTPITERDDGDSPEIPHDAEDVEAGLYVRLRGVGTVTNPEV